jgi:circadian clock protein KaiC
MNQQQPPNRIPTEIPGLDEVLCGGFFRSGVYLVMAPPGSGKTIFANQMAFNRAAHGERILYVTLLAESHAHMFSHLRKQKFFKEEYIGKNITYVGAYAVLESEGLKGFLKLLQNMVINDKPTLLILDGFAVADEISDSPVSFKKFVHQLNTFIAYTECSAFLLTSQYSDQVRAEHTMVDGILSLNIRPSNVTTVRELEVRKFRGSDHMNGRHFFRISESGMTVFPRLEERRFPPQTDTAPKGEKISIGIPRLDEILGGGITVGTSTVILGAAGTSKTTLAMHFLNEGAVQRQHGLFIGFNEPPLRLTRKVDALGMKLQAASAKGLVEFIWKGRGHFYMDEIGWEILEKVKEKNIKRVVIDGVAGLKAAASVPDRVTDCLAVITQELRRRGVTTLIVEESAYYSEDVLGEISNSSAVTDNLIHMRLLNCESYVIPAISIVKAREQKHERVVYTFEVEKDGIKIGQPLKDDSRKEAGTAKPAPGGKSKVKDGKDG